MDAGKLLPITKVTLAFMFLSVSAPSLSFQPTECDHTVKVFDCDNLRGVSRTASHRLRVEFSPGTLQSFSTDTIQSADALNTWIAEKRLGTYHIEGGMQALVDYMQSNHNALVDLFNQTTWRDKSDTTTFGNNSAWQ